MTLSDLKSPGTRLEDVEPDFRGMPFKEWRKKIAQSDSDAWHEKESAAWFQKCAEERSKHQDKQKRTMLADKAVATPRDNYGWRSA